MIRWGMADFARDEVVRPAFQRFPGVRNVKVPHSSRKEYDYDDFDSYTVRQSLIKVACLRFLSLSGVLLENVVVISSAIWINYVLKAVWLENPSTYPYANYITAVLNSLQSAILG